MSIEAKIDVKFRLKSLVQKFPLDVVFQVTLKKPKPTVCQKSTGLKNEVKCLGITPDAK